MLSMSDSVPFVRDIVSIVGCVDCNMYDELSGCSSTRARLRGESLPEKQGLPELIPVGLGARFGNFRLLGKQLDPSVEFS